MMEKKKIDAYNAGYKAPEPVDFGRWYESLAPEEMEKFREDMTEIEKRPYVYKPNPTNDDEHEWYGDTILLLFSKDSTLRNQNGKEKD